MITQVATADNSWSVTMATKKPAKAKTKDLSPKKASNVKGGRRLK